MGNRKISGARIILVGNLIVNLPVIVAIPGSAYLLFLTGLNWTLSVLAGGLLGWSVWSIALEYWKTWAFKKGIDRERLYKLGKIGLINFYRYRIFDDEKKEKNATK